MVSNRYGVAPLRARNGYLRGKAEYEDTWGKNVHWKTGVDVAVTPREKKIHVQQAYGELQYRGWEVIAGAKERYISLWDKELSSGDMIQSGNARPAPGLFISRPQFSSVPLTGGWLQWKGEFGVSLFVDGKYLAASTPENAYYVKHVRRHDKSLFLRLSDQQKHFPLYATAGLRHTAQWAGISTHPEYGGKQPHSFVDFLRIVMAQPGGDGASTPDRENVLGAHHMAYDMQLGYEQNDWAVQLYHQHIAGDKSGTELNNGIDGLWGIRGDLPCKWLRKMVIEYVTTRHQSGPFHFLWFDREKYPARGGGGDNYYNNGVYVNGHAHFGRSEGSPLLPSPEYNEDGRQGFLNTRILDWHIGLEGALAPTTSYRLLCTLMNGWGTSEEPFLQKKTGLSFLLETNYTFPQYPLSLIASLAGDTGDVFGLPAYAASLSLRWIVL
ncbi:MAG: capsule assembly Wzi family protein [Tannerellaceae bacterium]|nr:capsule assembly Wzi family protein [Tannerellaceae bacterium]